MKNINDQSPNSSKTSNQDNISTNKPSFNDISRIQFEIPEQRSPISNNNSKVKASQENDNNINNIIKEEIINFER